MLFYLVFSYLLLICTLSSHKENNCTTISACFFPSFYCYYLLLDTIAYVSHYSLLFSMHVEVVFFFFTLLKKMEQIQGRINLTLIWTNQKTKKTSSNDKTQLKINIANTNSKKNSKGSKRHTYGRKTTTTTRNVRMHSTSHNNSMEQ